MNNNEIDPAWFERIVEEVIRRLVERGVQMAPAGASELTSELNLDDRLVTLATLGKQLDGIKQVTVPHRAVVTPSVIDELRGRSITLVRRNPS